MNEASERRLVWARSVATVYAAHPDLGAIILGGSTARGVARPDSDIDLGLFWRRLPAAAERDALRRSIGGGLERFVANERRFAAGNPRRHGGIEIVTLPATAARPRLGLDLEHETVAGTEQVLHDVLATADLALAKQELLSVIQTGIVLTGHEVAARWREQTGAYPTALADQMVAGQLAGLGQRLLGQQRSLATEDWFCHYEGLLDAGRRLSLALLGLNRTWAFTDNPDFKGLASVVEGLAWRPERFVERLGGLLQGEAAMALVGLARLSEEVLDLVEAHLPGVETAGERRWLRRVGDRGNDRGTGLQTPQV